MFTFVVSVLMPTPGNDQLVTVLNWIVDERMDTAIETLSLALEKIITRNVACTVYISLLCITYLACPLSIVTEVQ